MAYIIENMNLLKKDKLEKISILVKNERISTITNEMKNYSYVKMNASGYITTNPHIIFDPKIPTLTSFSDMKSYMTERFLKRGCTTFLTYVSVSQEKKLKTSLKQAKMGLLSSPIDYVIGVKIPLSALTPSFIRTTKREKVPVFIEFSSVDELKEKPWGWIREAMFPYNSPLIPCFQMDGEREKKRAKQVWNEIMAKHNIANIREELMQGEPLTQEALHKIGILPLKSHLHPGSEVSYNFYRKSSEIINIDEKSLFLYHSDRLLVTVHKGEVIRAGDKVWFRSGYGEHVIINTPSFFTGE
ncbi:hypothetical protein [Robertmurraya sp. FSL R5-0851]|uniref:hypothetical protein n=1 Tax=Robertmurraya sp. FSL R5-0851 TaxID=2921584 RepID=UPI00136C938C